MPDTYFQNELSGDKAHGDTDLGTLLYQHDKCSLYATEIKVVKLFKEGNRLEAKREIHMHRHLDGSEFIHLLEEVLDFGRIGLMFSKPAGISSFYVPIAVLVL